jgi:hypothetical protein
MTPEHLEHLEAIATIQYRGIVEYECRACQTTQIYHASVRVSPLIDGLCDLCLAEREDQAASGIEDSPSRP